MARDTQLIGVVVDVYMIYIILLKKSISKVLSFTKIKIIINLKKKMARTAGYNKLQVAPIGEEVVTLRGKARKQAAIHRAIYLISLGMAYYDVVDRICEEFDYTPRSPFVTQKIMTEANKIVKEKESYYAEGIALRNIARLEQMIQKCLDDGNVALANKCLDTLNKTANIYNTKIEVKNGDEAEFKIKLK